MVTWPVSCIRIADEKTQMHMQVQGRWACPKELTPQAGTHHFVIIRH